MTDGMTAEPDVEAAIDRSEARELLIDLVRIPSPSGEETACARHLVSFFEAHDREAWIDEAGNVRAPADDSLLLTSHIDTVPGDIPVRTRDGILWGRGSVDAKGPLAAMAVAAVERGVSFAGVVAEEVDSAGALALVEDRPEPDAVVNGEPGGWDGITLGYRGLLGGTYVGASESGHSSRPTPNAIQDAMTWWDRVEEAFERDEWDSVFEQVTPKPVAIEGGTSPDGLSLEVAMDVQLRIPPSLTPESVREIVDGELESGTVTWWDEVQPVVVSPRTPLARAFRVAIREDGGDPRLVRKTGTSDMNVYAEAWDAPIVTYGPGDSGLDHTPDEHLDMAEYDRAIGILKRVATRMQEDQK